MKRTRKPVVLESTIAKMVSKKTNLSEPEIYTLIHLVATTIAEVAEEGKAIRVEPLGYIHYSKTLRRNKNERPGGFLITKTVPFENVEEKDNKGEFD